jgi:hypothetical protein
MSKWATEKGIMSKQLAVMNKQSFDQKVKHLKQIALNLLKQNVNPQTTQQAQETDKKLATLNVQTQQILTLVIR